MPEWHTGMTGNLLHPCGADLELNPRPVHRGLAAEHDDGLRLAHRPLDRREPVLAGADAADVGRSEASSELEKVALDHLLEKRRVFGFFRDVADEKRSGNHGALASGFGHCAMPGAFNLDLAPWRHIPRWDDATARCRRFMVNHPQVCGTRLQRGTATSPATPSRAARGRRQWFASASESPVRACAQSPPMQSIRCATLRSRALRSKRMTARS